MSSGQRQSEEIALVDRGGIRQLQSLVTEMLVELDRVASKAGLRYFLAYGTLLGAVRDTRFIAWDFDADVLVPHQEYEELCRALEEGLPSHLQLLRPGSSSGYEFAFARIAHRGVDHKFLRVDLFPLSRGPNHLVARRIFAWWVHGLNLALMLKRMVPEEMVHYTAAKRLVARLAKLVLAAVSGKALLRWTTALQTLNFSGDTLTNACGSYGLREFFDAAWFEEQTRVTFEGHVLSSPGDSGAFLQRAYGDFMTPIPVEDQERALAFATKYYVEPLRALGIVT